MASLAENVASVKDRVKQAAKVANSAAKLPRIIAVSKTRNAQQIEAVYQSGLMEFGENYLQEATKKMALTSHLDICWHFIGPIQSNKTAVIARHFDWVQSVDRIKIAKRLSDQRPADMPPLKICIQINADREDTKSGIDIEDLGDFAAQIRSYSQLKLRGIMCIPKQREHVEDQIVAYKKIVTRFRSLQQQYPDIDTLSLGMSGDLEAAIKAGSTMLRIGTDIFGPRN